MNIKVKSTEMILTFLMLLRLPRGGGVGMQAIRKGGKESVL